MAKDEAHHALLEDLNACGSEALTALDEGRLADVLFNIRALLDAVREALEEIEEEST